MKAITAKVKYHQNLIIPISKKFIAASLRAKKSFELTTLNFKQVSPNFLIEQSKKGGHLIRVIGPQDDKSGQVWTYLSHGTLVRYAIMTPDFSPKTTPNTLVTTVGAGKLSHFDFDNPKPGIEARLWTEIVAVLEMEKLEKDVGSIIKKSRVFRN